MKDVDAKLIVCGAGNFFEQAVALCKEHKLEHKITFHGYLPPDQLRSYTLNAWVGITLFEATSLSNRLSLANRFFDYMHSAVPQLCIKYPEYEKINAQYEIASLIEDPAPENIAVALNKMLTDDIYYKRLQQNCLAAREKYCWQQETVTLLKTYESLAAS
jgi:glycosyltransferase involved in cell wall biosynthesis